MYKLYNDNSLNVLDTFADNSIDAVITDPPYGITHLDKEFNPDVLNNTAKSGGMFKGNNLGGMKFSNNQNKQTYNFLLPFFQKSLRVLKPGAFCIVFSQGRLVAGVMNALIEAGFEIREQMFWRKPSAKPNQQTPWKKNSKNKDFTDRVIFGPGKVIESFIIAQKPIEGSYSTNYLKYHTGLVNKELTTTTVFEENTATIKEKEGLTHPTIKPIKLMERIVEAFTEEGQTVLDIFNGSGSTGIAALNKNRNYIGIELNKQYYKESLKRFATINSQKTKNCKKISS